MQNNDPANSQVIVGPGIDVCFIDLLLLTPDPFFSTIEHNREENENRGSFFKGALWNRPSSSGFKYDTFNVKDDGIDFINHSISRESSSASIVSTLQNIQVPKIILKLELDITRISNRILVMGRAWHHRTLQSSHCNNIDELGIFLQTRYGRNFMIWNVGSTEVNYDTAILRNQVVNFQLSRLLPPTLKTLFNASKSMAGWLALSPNNVAIVQCKNGLSRSGLFVACFLKYCEIFGSAHEAFEYFLHKRSPTDQSWVTITLRRYLRYFNDTIILVGRVPNDCPLHLHQVILNGVPNFDGSGSCNPGIEIYQNGKLTYSTSVRLAELESFRGRQEQSAFSLLNQSNQAMADDQEEDGEDDVLIREFQLSLAMQTQPSQYYNPLVLQDKYHVVFGLERLQLERDVLIRIYHRNVQTSQNITMITLSFNTGFMMPGLVRLRKSDLELYSLTCDRFTSDFSVDLIIASVENDSSSVTKSINYSSACLKSRAKDLLKLSQFHKVRPDPLLAKPLELQGHRKFFSRLALQLGNNDIHSAHEFLDGFRKSQVYESIDKDLVYLSKMKYDQMRISHVQKEEATSNPNLPQIISHNSSNFSLELNQLETAEERPSIVDNASVDFDKDQVFHDERNDFSDNSKKVAKSAIEIFFQRRSRQRSDTTSSIVDLVCHEEEDCIDANTKSDDVSDSQNLVATASNQTIPISPPSPFKQRNISSSMKSSLSTAHRPSDESNVVPVPPEFSKLSGKIPSAPPFLKPGSTVPLAPKFPKKTSVNDATAVVPSSKEVKTMDSISKESSSYSRPSSPLNDTEVSGSSRYVSRLRIKNALHWDEIRDQKRIRNTVWLEMMESSQRNSKDGGNALDDVELELDLHRFEELFCVDPNSIDRSRTPRLEEADKYTRIVCHMVIIFFRNSKVSILDLRRANNVGIGLSRFYKRLEDEEILECLINGSQSMENNANRHVAKSEKTYLTIDDLLTLKNCLPSKEEAELIRIFKGDVRRLNRAERFMLAMVKEPYAQWMVDSLIFERQFLSEVETIKSKLSSFIVILSKIRESPTIKVLLRTVLELGNLANYDYGKHAGSMSFSKSRALGFSMDSLIKLHEVKSVDRSTTLVHYLVSILESRHPEVLTLPQEFGSDLSISKHWDSATILSQLSELESGFSRFHMKSFAESKDSRIEEFCANQHGFFISAKYLLDETSVLGERFKLAWNNTAEYLGEDALEKKPEYLLDLFDQFFRHLYLAHQDNKRKVTKPFGLVRRTQSDLSIPRDSFKDLKLSYSSSFTNSGCDDILEQATSKSEVDTLSLSENANFPSYISNSLLDNAEKDSC